MKYDFQLVYIFIAIGLIYKKLNWKGWFGVSLLVMGWIAFNVLKK